MYKKKKNNNNKNNTTKKPPKNKQFFKQHKENKTNFSQKLTDLAQNG